MDSVGGFGYFNPLSMGGGVFLPEAGSIQAIQVQNYLAGHLYSNSLPATCLYDRLVAPAYLPGIYTSHSQPVGHLLDQRSVMEYQLQKTQAMSAYMFGLMGFSNQLPFVQGLFKGEPFPVTPANYDLLFYGPGVDRPVSILQNEGADILKPFSSQFKPIVDGLSEPLINAAPLFQQYLPLAARVEGALENQLQLNGQQLVFEGYPLIEKEKSKAMVYPLEGVNQWLGTSDDATVQGQTAFLADKPEYWPGQPNIYFAPGSPNALPGHMFDLEPDISPDSQWNHFLESYEQFYHPVGPKDYDLGKDSLYRHGGGFNPAVTSYDKTKNFKQETTRDRSIGDDLNILDRKADRELLPKLSDHKKQGLDTSSTPKKKRLLNDFKEQNEVKQGDDQNPAIDENTRDALKSNKKQKTLKKKLVANEFDEKEQGDVNKVSKNISRKVTDSDAEYVFDKRKERSEEEPVLPEKKKSVKRNKAAEPLRKEEKRKAVDADKEKTPVADSRRDKRRKTRSFSEEVPGEKPADKKGTAQKSKNHDKANGKDTHVGNTEKIKLDDGKSKDKPKNELVDKRPLKKDALDQKHKQTEKRPLGNRKEKKPQSKEGLDKTRDQKKAKVRPIRAGSVKASSKKVTLVKSNEASVEEKDKDKYKIKTGILGRCIEILSDRQNKDQRKALNILFSSQEGERLFDSNSFPVDKKHTIEFIRLYKEAIRKEVKPNKINSKKEDRLKKKEERLKAITEIEVFVEELEEKDEDCAALCRLAIQLCGRVRERSLVHQKSIEFCGGFSMLHSGWGLKPLQMTESILDLARNYETKVRVVAEPYEKLISVPPKTNLSDYDEALADKLLLSTLYDLKKKGSSGYVDAVRASFFGIPVKICTKDEKDISDNDFLLSLSKASRSKCVIRGALNDKLAGYLSANMGRIRGIRDQEKDDYVKIDLNKGGYKPLVDHAVIFDKLSVVGDMVYIKLYSWGRVEKFSISKSDFLKNINKEGFLIFPKSDQAVYEGFSDPKLDSFVYNEKKGAYYYHDCFGSEKKMEKGEVFEGVSGKQYAWVGEKSFQTADTKKRERLVVLSDLSSAVVFNKGEKEVGVKLPDGKNIIANQKGEYREAQPGDVIFKPDGKQKMYKGNGLWSVAKETGSHLVYFDGEVYSIPPGKEDALIPLLNGGYCLANRVGVNRVINRYEITKEAGVDGVQYALDINGHLISASPRNYQKLVRLGENNIVKVQRGKDKVATHNGKKFVLDYHHKKPVPLKKGRVTTTPWGERYVYIKGNKEINLTDKSKAGGVEYFRLDDGRTIGVEDETVFFLEVGKEYTRKNGDKVSLLANKKVQTIYKH